MNRHGFTLIEAVLALVVASGLFLLATGTDRRLVRPLQHDPVAWYQAVRVLEQPGKYQFCSLFSNCGINSGKRLCMSHYTARF